MHFYCEILAARNWDWGRLTRSPGGRKCKTHGVDNLAGVQQKQLVPWFDAFVDMVEREFENYTSPLPTEINYCYWQTVKLRTLRVSRSSVWWSRWERERELELHVTSADRNQLLQLSDRQTEDIESLKVLSLMVQVRLWEGLRITRHLYRQKSTTPTGRLWNSGPSLLLTDPTDPLYSTIRQFHRRTSQGLAGAAALPLSQAKTSFFEQTVNFPGRSQRPEIKKSIYWMGKNGIYSAQQDQVPEIRDFC